MAHSEKEKSLRIDCGWTKARKLSAPISLEDLMVKELPLTLEDSDMRKLSAHTDPTNEDSTRINPKIWYLDNPNKLSEVLRARLAISQCLTCNKISMGPIQYCYTWTLLDGEVLRLFDLNLTELPHKTVSNLISVMDHVMT